MNPLSLIGANLLGYALAKRDGDWPTTLLDMLLVQQGKPTHEAMRRAAAAKRAREQLEAARAGQLEAFARGLGR